jgi:hypothetical protein
MMARQRKISETMAAHAGQGDTSIHRLFVATR